MNWNLAHWFVYGVQHAHSILLACALCLRRAGGEVNPNHAGEVDWDQLESRLRGVCPFLSGAMWVTESLHPIAVFCFIKSLHVLTLHAPRVACCLYRFGAGWWCLIDALVYSKVVLNETYPFTYNLPGIIATVALIMMNLVSRDDLANMGDSYSSEEGSEVSTSVDLPCHVR